MTSVANKKTHTPTPNDVYIGRPSPWGNTYSHLPSSLAEFKVGTRKEAIAKFDEWIHLPEQQQYRNDARKKLKGRTLVCWCKPLSCHGDVLAAIAESEME